MLIVGSSTASHQASSTHVYAGAINIFDLTNYDGGGDSTINHLTRIDGKQHCTHLNQLQRI